MNKQITSDRIIEMISESLIEADEEYLAELATKLTSYNVYWDRNSSNFICLSKEGSQYHLFGYLLKEAKYALLLHPGDTSVSNLIHRFYCTYQDDLCGSKCKQFELYHDCDDLEELPQDRLIHKPINCVEYLIGKCQLPIQFVVSQEDSNDVDFFEYYVFESEYIPSMLEQCEDDDTQKVYITKAYCCYQDGHFDEIELNTVPNVYMEKKNDEIRFYIIRMSVIGAIS